MQWWCPGLPLFEWCLFQRECSGCESNLRKSINDLGQTVGTYANANTGIDGGFLESRGSFTSINSPGAVSTCATGINDLDEILGTYTDVEGRTLISHGFLDFSGSFESLTFPGATSTTASGINNLGLIVGSYTLGAQPAQPFVYFGGSYFPIDVPGMAGATVQPTGINDPNEIVGLSNLLGSPYAFIYTDGTSHWISAPGSYETLAGGINDFGGFIGSDYYDDEVAAYVADPAATLASEPPSFVLLGVAIFGVASIKLRPKCSL